MGSSGPSARTQRRRGATADGSAEYPRRDSGLPPSSQRSPALERFPTEWIRAIGICKKRRIGKGGDATYPSGGDVPASYIREIYAMGGCGAGGKGVGASSGEAVGSASARRIVRRSDCRLKVMRGAGNGRRTPLASGGAPPSGIGAGSRATGPDLTGYPRHSGGRLWGRPGTNESVAFSQGLEDHAQK